MAKDYCAYHTAKAASWNCPSCGSLLCLDCFPARPEPMRPPYCTLCGGDMRYLGVGNSLPPFWSQMHRFFAYPFKPNSLIFLAVLALLTTGTALVFSSQEFFIWAPIFIIVSLIIRQGLRVIEFCSQGKSDPPNLLDLFDGNPSTLKMIGLMLAYGAAVGVLGGFGLLGGLAIIALSALLPASIMLLAIRGSLLEALNPSEVFHLAAKTGWSYLGLILVLIIISAGPEQAMGLMPQATLQYLTMQKPYVLFSLFAVSTAYFNMVMGAMMGYLLFQHHDDLGIKADTEDDVRPTDKRALDLARATLFIRESRFDDALSHLGGMISDYPNDADVQERYHKLLCETGKYPDRVAPHTERYLELLLKSQRKNRMLPAYEAARRIVPDYRPKQITVRTALAEEYFRLHQYKQAIVLIGMLHKEAPKSEDLPAAYYLLARIYSEGLHDDDKAIMIMDFLRANFPDHPLAHEIDNYRKVVLSLRQDIKAST